MILGKANMLACVCGFIIEGLIMLSVLGLSCISIPIANTYNAWCRRKHKHNCKRHKDQKVIEPSSELNSCTGVNQRLD